MTSRLYKFCQKISKSIPEKQFCSVRTKMSCCQGNVGFIILQMVAIVTSQRTLQIGWLVPTSSHPAANFPFNASSSIAALALGIETVQNQSLLPDYTINVTMLDSGCDSKQSLGVLTDQLFIQPLDVVIGPPCADVVQAVGELLSYRNIPLLNWVSTGQSISNKMVLDTYIRTMAPISSLGGIMTLFYFYTGWRRLIIISSEGDDYAAGADTIITNLNLYTFNGFNIVHHYEKVTIGASQDEIDSIFSTIIHEGRIIIMLVPRDELRTYMLRAYALGMTGGDYQFLFTDLTLADSQDINFITSDALWKKGDRLDSQARQAFENVLYFVLGHGTHNSTEWSDEALSAFDRVFPGRSDLPTPTQPDEYSAYLHDTVLLYAMTLNKSLPMNDSGSGIHILGWVYTVYFKGLSGDVVMNYIGDRQPTFFVYDLDSDGHFHQVSSLYYTIVGEQVEVNSTFIRIIWGNGLTSDNYIPPDTPDCGFFNEFCTPAPVTDNTLVISVSVGVSMLVLLLILFLIFRWWRSEKELNSMAWKILPCELNYAITKRISSVYLSDKTDKSVVSMNSSSIQGTFRSMGNVSQARLSLNRGQIFTTVALFKGDVVAVKKSFKRKISVDRPFMLEMKNISELKHGNITNLLGVCTVPENICSVWEYCNKGSLQDVIENDDIKLDTMFKLSIAVDICQGLEYIHKSPLKVHGNLKSSNCVIDSRWVCKLTDFGLHNLKTTLSIHSEETGEHAAFARLLWTAPEILRQIMEKQPIKYTQAGDIYALGIVLKELVCRNEPYCDSADFTPKEIIMKVANKKEDEVAFRPIISDPELDSEYRQTNMAHLIRRCWAEEPADRPSIKAVLRTLNKINPYKKSSVVDNMIAMMERYTNNLEDIVTERTEQLQEEKIKTDALLYRMLPKKVAEDLKFGRSVEAEAFDSVTIYFSDIVQFTNLAGESTPLQIVALLNSLYTLFDDIISHYDVYKVETIGDAYMIVSGLPEKNGNQHVKEIAGVALDILNSVLTFKIPHRPDRQLQLRIGLHTGSVVAGVVGLTMPRYCLFGDTVNTASRMESNGKPLKIHCSSATYQALRDFPSFVIEERGEIPIKGKGVMKTYWLLGNDGMCSLINLEENNSPESGNETNKAVLNSTLPLPREDREIKDRHVKDSGVSMSLDQEIDDGTKLSDQEANALRNTLIGLHNKIPEENASDNGQSSDNITDSDMNYESDDENSETDNKTTIGRTKCVTETEDGLNKGAAGMGASVRKDYKPKRVKIAPASEDYCKLGQPYDHELLRTSDKGKIKHTSTLSNASGYSVYVDQHPDFGNMYHQQKNGSKTLEIYNNIAHP